MRDKNGYVIYEDAYRVAIATGFKRRSRNRKTGAMIQVWILVKGANPVRAANTGRDKLVCGTCPLRGAQGQARACYVNLSQAPLSVYRAWRRRAYPPLPSLDLFAGRKVRWGAYGDPAYLPLRLIEAITRRCAGWTGYTHQWLKPHVQAYQQWLMASVEDSDDNALVAVSKGWRTYRVVRTRADLQANEILCPDITRRVTCAKCLLCGGAAKRAKSITIPVHGPGALHFQV